MIERGVATQYFVAVSAATSPGCDDGFSKTMFGDFFGNKFGAVDVMIHLFPLRFGLDVRTANA